MTKSVSVHFFSKKMNRHRFLLKLFLGYNPPNVAQRGRFGVWSEVVDDFADENAPKVGDRIDERPVRESCARHHRAEPRRARPSAQGRPAQAAVGAIILEYLQLRRDVFKSQGKTGDDLRALVRQEATKKYLAAIDKEMPADGKVVLNGVEQAGVNSLVAEVLGDQAPNAPVAPPPVKPDGAPSPPVPVNPQAMSDRIAPDFAIIARAVKNEDANIRGEAGITAETRKSRLLQYALGLFARAADVVGADPSKLTDAEKAQAASLVDDVIAGKTLVALKSPDSRLLTDDLKSLLDALVSKNRQLILAGSDPKSLNHRDQLIDFAKAQVAAVAPGDLKPAETSEIENLVDQVRFNATLPTSTGVAPTTKPAKEMLTPEILDRLIPLAGDQSRLELDRPRSGDAEDDPRQIRPRTGRAVARPGIGRNPRGRFSSRGGSDRRSHPQQRRADHDDGADNHRADDRDTDHRADDRHATGGRSRPVAAEPVLVPRLPTEIDVHTDELMN